MSEASGQYRILVVEDNPHVAELFRTAIQRIVAEHLGGELEVRVDTAADGQEAWAILEASVLERTPFSLVVLDLMLPVLDGTAVLERLRAHATLRRLKVLVITATDKDGIEEAKAAGADAILRKPVQFNTIRDVVAQIL